MTEIGMALSNPLDAEKRIPGYVGSPMPSVKVALAAVHAEDELVAGDRDYDILAECSGDAPDDLIIHATSTSSKEKPSAISGELFVGGPSVFSQYWNRPEATLDSFTTDGIWFKTGDTAVVEDGVFKIFGAWHFRDDSKFVVFKYFGIFFFFFFFFFSFFFLFLFLLYLLLLLLFLHLHLFLLLLSCSKCFS